MSRSTLLVLCWLVLYVVPPCSGQYQHEDKSALTQETLFSGQEFDWPAEPATAGTATGSGAASVPGSLPACPGSNALGLGNNLNFTGGAPAAAPGWAHWPGAAPVWHGQGAAAPYMQRAAGAVPAPAYMPYQPVFLVPQSCSSAGGAQAIANPSYAPAVVPSYMLQQPAAAAYPVIIIQQGSAYPQQASTAPAQAQPQNQQPSQPPNAAAADQAAKPGLKGFVNALMGASSSMFTGGVAGNSLTVARPLLDLLLNGL
ncbi:MAG TPA: hypothetical protein V6D08_04140 [Candidatus Obscuribacterales bacterium]